jgi:hypothetical protein
MNFAGMNYLAVLASAIAGYGFGAAWYSFLGARWMAALGITDPPKPSPTPFIIAFACQLFMAWMMAGLIGHLGEVTFWRSVFAAAFIWAGFILTTMMVNHRFQSASWTLTLIDGAHWLGVCLIMGAVIGATGL